MKKNNTKKISTTLSALLVVSLFAGCKAEQNSSANFASIAETEKLDDKAVADVCTGIDDMYIEEGAKDIDYLCNVLYDGSIVKDVDVDSSAVDTTKIDTYKIAYEVEIERKAYDAYKEKVEKDAANKSATKSESVSNEETSSTDKTDNSTEDTKTVAGTETVVIEKEVSVVDTNRAQELADKNIPVYKGNNETVKKTDGSEVVREQKKPSSSTVSGGIIIEASTKEEVKPVETEKPTVQPTEETKQEEKEETSTNASNSNNNSSSSNTTAKPSTGSSSSSTTVKPSTGSSSATTKPSAGTTNSGNSSASKSESKPSSSSSSNNSQPAHTHTWVDVTTTINHPAVTHEEDIYESQQVLVTPAYDEKVYVRTDCICRKCGFTTSNIDEMTDHMVETGHSCTSEDIYDTVHHDAVYETQSVKVGTKTVVDQEAWTETVVTGQKCSTCGATK